MLQNVYSLDSQKTLKIHNFEFKDTYSSMLIDNGKYLSLSIEARYTNICKILKSLDSSTNKGFLTSTDLSKYPIISDFLTSFIDGSEEYMKGGKSMESYK